MVVAPLMAVFYDSCGKPFASWRKWKTSAWTPRRSRHSAPLMAIASALLDRFALLDDLARFVPFHAPVRTNPKVIEDKCL